MPSTTAQWPQILKTDSRAIFVTASGAQRAIEWREEPQLALPDGPSRPSSANTPGDQMITGLDLAV
jgi:antirestriction protein ArdC